MIPLSELASNNFSQFGEDGIIEECLSRISEVTDLSQWCVEFGAWDGQYLSNTCNLVKNFYYHAVLIEGDAERFRALEKNFKDQPVFLKRRWVELDGQDSLDSILSETPLPFDFDLLSIDIDGADYWVWESVKEFKPKIVVIEFNPTIPNSVHFVQDRDIHIAQGSSAKAISMLGEQKGYGTVAATWCNLVLVRKEFLHLFPESKQDLENLIPDRNTGVQVFVGYDGTLLYSETRLNLPWHEFTFALRNLQVLPKFLRKYRPNYSDFEERFFKIFTSRFRKERGAKE